MIPIRLALEAFGPFARKQEIDFTLFDSDRIFLICGNTGSGKTTLFDAVTFCLYGTASGSIREADSFRSGFVEENALCWAEFEFLVRGKRYRVRRTPIQYRLRRTGNISRENSTAELTFEDGSILSGPAAVDEKIREILGIGADQFKKIVMLPQGEFRKFLSDDSAEKQKTLRRIFSTFRLDDFTERLKQKAGAARAELASLETSLTVQIDGIAAETDSELGRATGMESRDPAHILSLLKTDNSRESKEERNLRGQAETLALEKDALDPARAEELAGKFELLARTKEEVQLLEAKKPEQLALSARLSSLKAARELAAYDEAAAAAAKELSLLRARQKETAAAQKETALRETAAREAYESARKEQEKAPALAREGQVWRSRLEILEKLKTTEAEQAQQKAEGEALRQRGELLQKARRYALLYQEDAGLAERQKAMREAQSALLRCGELNKAYLLENQNYRRHMDGFLESQAFQLAGQLAEGAPCPVCGSREHPHPAEATAFPVSREQLDEARKRYEKAERALKEQAGACRPLITAAGFDYSSHDRLSKFLPDLNAALEDCASKRAVFAAEMNIPGLDERMRTGDLEQVDRALADCSSKTAVNLQRCSDSDKRFHELKQQLGGETLTAGEIRGKIEAVESQIRQLSARLDDASREKERLSGESNRLREAASQLEERMASLAETEARARERFLSRLAETRLSPQDFQALKADLPRMDELETALRSWQKELAQKEGMLKSLSQQVEGKTPPDLEALRARHAAVSDKLAEVQTAMENIRIRLAQNRAAAQRISTALVRRDAAFEQCRKLEHLYDVANGRYSDRVNFERYVLAGYFTEVIRNANIRLEEMTGARYTLSRRTDREKGNKSSGLALEVFDAYTGKARHVNTLSGGESFKISLALALGLADIVSEYSGGIELNTIFIDEGFGSLDGNSLETAVECLQKLRDTGRYVGIISHVSELREKIPAKINVIQEPQGSYVKVQV